MGSTTRSQIHDDAAASHPQKRTTPESSFMRCLFVTNQLKTEFYEPLARGLAERGMLVYWISVSTRWTRHLLEHGWPRNCILSLEDFGPEWEQDRLPSADERARVHRIESLCETSLKNTIIMDRELSKRLGNSGELYIYVVTREIERFVVENDIMVGFGEDTWAPEILTWLVMASVDRRYLVPHSLRIPSTRFVFFNTVFHHSIESVRSANANDVVIAREAISNLREHGERPFYFARRNNPHRLRKHWIKEALHHLTHSEEGRFDHTIPRLVRRVGRRIRSQMQVVQVRRAAIFERAPPDSGKPFLFVPLQLQPESSIDVYGNALSNQMEIVKATARLLPFDWEIWVKEHPHAVGNRPLSYYHELLNIPGLRLIHYDEDSMALIRKAAIVASVSGTASMEAGILGVPAITFAPMFFGELLLRNGFDPFNTTHHAFREIIGEAARFRCNTDRERLVEQQLGNLVAQSFLGIVSDPINAPDCTSKENLAHVTDACIAIMERSSTHHPVA